ncbi:hypothetical protein IJ707_06625 [bacterium]|nr:hypothetical protein [bacterium]
MFHYRHGPYIETAVALFITHHLKDSPYFAKFYFANPKEVYMVTEYVHQCMDIREDFRAMEVRKIEDVDIKDKLVTEFFQKITGEEISHYKILKTLKGGCFRYLDYLYDNFIVYEDENKNKHVKMVDFGWCISYNENLRVV